MRFDDLKFNKYGYIEIGRCKGRKELEANLDKGKKLKVLIEAEIDHVFGNFDGVGTQVTLIVNSVKRLK